MIRPRYPIFIPSKGRHEVPLTIRCFQRDGVDFKVVVNAEERDAYAKVAGASNVIVLPESNRGLVYSRNWIKDYARAQGHERHWQFDDDIQKLMRAYKGCRINCASGPAIAAMEDFVDRYENVGLASMNSEFFVPQSLGAAKQSWPPFYRNARCYTVFLVLNSTPLRFRGPYNEDTDMTLQVLASGLCTILFNVFLIKTPTTMSYQGGQTDIYVNDGRLRMARNLERRWPGVVDVVRRFHRPQHKVRDHWQKFDTPLKLKPIKSDGLRRIVEEK